MRGVIGKCGECRMSKLHPHHVRPRGNLVLVEVLTNEQRLLLPSGGEPAIGGGAEMSGADFMSVRPCVQHGIRVTAAPEGEMHAR